MEQYSFPRSRTSLRLGAPGMNKVCAIQTFYVVSQAFPLRLGDSASTLRGEIKSNLLDGSVAVCTQHPDSVTELLRARNCSLARDIMQVYIFTVCIQSFGAYVLLAKCHFQIS